MFQKGLASVRRLCLLSQIYCINGVHKLQLEVCISLCFASFIIMV
uniref:Uncharacterized protein n=1 Tax=Rhizophora mucronata TaxID=61149 RepID=A0A2P2LYE6_RHIMU